MANNHPATRHKAREQYKALKKADKAKQLAITDALTKNQSSVVSEPIEDEVKQNQANAELAPAKEMANSEEMP